MLEIQKRSCERGKVRGFLLHPKIHVAYSVARVVRRVNSEKTFCLHIKTIRVYLDNEINKIIIPEYSQQCNFSVFNQGYHSTVIK